MSLAIPVAEMDAADPAAVLAVVDGALVGAATGHRSSTRCVMASRSPMSSTGASPAASGPNGSWKRLLTSPIGIVHIPGTRRIVLAAAELDAYGQMARREPRLVLRYWDDGMLEVREAQSATSYFWFLSGAPEMFDRIDTVHTPPGTWKPKWGRPKIEPARIEPMRVRYYRNPLGRLVKLHQSYQELSTGLFYRSPFQRPDSRVR
jgi:hypothetical protein